jgi:hypothetical protein
LVQPLRGYSVAIEKQPVIAPLLGAGGTEMGVDETGAEAVYGVAILALVDDGLAFITTLQLVPT